MKLKAQIQDEAGLNRALMRIAHEILEHNKGAENLCLVGVRRRGEPIARRIAENIQKIEDREVPVGSVDISFYRDDLSRLRDMPELSRTELPFDVNDRDLVLVDDVIYTGRTARAAIEAIFSCGRPGASSWPWPWTGATGSFPSGRILWAKTCPPPARSWWRFACRSLTGRPAST